MAEDNRRERVYVYVDKNCYVAGEDIWLKFYVVHPDFKPSSLSKVGYVEICDTEKPQMQIKLALENGRGAGRIKIPNDIPSGYYQLSGYTRYMKNEGEIVYFSRKIAIVNVDKPSLPERMEVLKTDKNQPENRFDYPGNIQIKTDRSEYSNRDLVRFSLNNLPPNISDMVVSVSRNDSIVFSESKVDPDAWMKQTADVSVPFTQSWLPEYEGHIITGRFVPDPDDSRLVSNISFVGKDIQYLNGQIDPDGKSVCFYTTGIYGAQNMVSSVVSYFNTKLPYRVDIVTPFSELLPEKLPILQIYPNEKCLTERYVATQLPEIIRIDTMSHSIFSGNYYQLKPSLSYNLSQYTRFSTLSETILEFVDKVRVGKVDGKRKIRVFVDELDRYNSGNTLVLLDGVPIYDHEDILRYNPQNISMLYVCDGRYVFGGLAFDGIVSFVTYQGNLPFFQLNTESQLVEYDCPFLPEKLNSPDYSDEVIRKSRKPDFRHTLYWNPFVESGKDHPDPHSFYTSDLKGEFKISVEGITTDGQVFFGVSCFQVK